MPTPRRGLRTGTERGDRQGLLSRGRASARQGGARPRPARVDQSEQAGPSTASAPATAGGVGSGDGGPAAEAGDGAAAKAGPSPRLQRPRPSRLQQARGRKAAAKTGAPAKKAAGNGNGAAVPERVQRLLAVVKPEAIQKVERQPMDRVNVWPHLMAAEFVSLLVVLGRF